MTIMQWVGLALLVMVCGVGAYRVVRILGRMSGAVDGIAGTVLKWDGKP